MGMGWGWGKFYGDGVNFFTVSFSTTYTLLLAFSKKDTVIISSFTARHVAIIM